MAERVRVQASAAVFNVALCLALIPFWEAMGAAIATVVTEAFLLIAYLALARREFLQGLVAIRQRVWLLSAPAAALVVGAIVTGPEWVPAVCGGLAIAGLAVLFGPYFGRNLLKPLTWGRVEEEGSVTA
jgi:O-antigen/teichoic acid export membrane protein